MFQFNFGSQENTSRNDIVHNQKYFVADLRQHIFNMRKLNSPSNSNSESSLTLKSYTLSFTKNKATRSDYIYSLLPSVYEGGCEIWECTIDLLRYLEKNPSLVKNKVVFDLGCGSGLLGIFALLLGAKKVNFIDFNADVIEEYVFPNLLNNLKSNLNRTESCRFYSGDWSHPSLAETVGLNDLILSSETIYDSTKYEGLLNALATTLEENGRVLMASKVHYFGVGGSVDSFCQFAAAKFSSTVLYSELDGIERQIISLQKINP